MHQFKRTMFNPLTEAHGLRSLRITMAEAAAIMEQVGERDSHDNGVSAWNLQIVQPGSFKEPRCTLAIDQWGTCTLAAMECDIPACCAALGEILRNAEIIEMPQAA